MQVKKEGYGQTPDDISYWSKHRSKIDDLYPSEKHFFIPHIKKSKSVLDIGCAAGGSALFTREINSEVQYTGVDNSITLIQSAQKRLEGMAHTRFLHFDGYKLPLTDSEVDFSFSFGVFHHLDHWKEMVFEALRVSSQSVLFDLRLWEKETLIDHRVSYQKLAVGGAWDQESIIPYNIISMTELKSLAKALNEIGINCKAFGYYQKPTDLAVTPAKEVLMLSVLLEKNSKSADCEIQIT